ncbi:MAG: gluconate 2-dehydrogenase subunit 3 family protein [Hyphomicrobiaceae bacterium]
MRRSDITGRREFIQLMAAAAASGLAGAGLSSEARGEVRKGRLGPQLKFFTRGEFATLDEMAEMIIPGDRRSGGARAAHVAEMIDARLAESLDPEWRQSWKDDIAEINELSRRKFRRQFVDASAKQRAQLMDLISRNEDKPKEAAEYAFGTIKWTVGETYYRTRIGIHDEIGYKGNVIQDEFSGIDVSRG